MALTPGMAALQLNAVKTNTSAPATGYFNRYDVTAGALTVTLPALSGLNVGARVAVQKYTLDASGNAVTFNCAGSDKFDDATTATLVLSLPGEQREIQVVSITGVKRWKLVGSLGGGAQSAEESDYVVSVAGSVYTAAGRAGLTTYTGSNFTTVLQNAIDALTPASTRGSGGGKIHLTKGQYALGNEVVITGWEGITDAALGTPFSQLVIEGEGYATQITQNTSGQNAFVIKNCASVSFVDMLGIVGAAAKSFILGDSNGADSEMSFFGGTLSLFVDSHSTTVPAIYLKNFMNLNVPKLWAYNSGHIGIQLENDSSTVNYGNSHFGMVTGYGKPDTHPGLALVSTTTTNVLNQVTFDNYECNGGFRGIYAKGASYCTFLHVDLEDNATCLYLDSATGPAVYTTHLTVGAGYMLPRASGTGIFNNTNSGGHSIKSYISTGAGSVTPIDDAMQFMTANHYDIQVQNDADITTTVANVDYPTRLRIDSAGGEVYETPLPTFGPGIPFGAGLYYRLAEFDPAASVSNLVGNEIIGLLFVPGRTAVMTELGVKVTTGGSAGSVLRFGVWEINGLAATLLDDLGTIVSTGTGELVQAGGTARLFAGRLYFASVTSQVATTTPVVTQISPGARYSVMQAGFPSALFPNPTLSRVAGGASGALPSSGTLEQAGSVFPAIVGRCD